MVKIIRNDAFISIFLRELINDGVKDIAWCSWINPFDDWNYLKNLLIDCHFKLSLCGLEDLVKSYQDILILIKVREKMKDLKKEYIDYRFSTAGYVIRAYIFEFSFMGLENIRKFFEMYKNGNTPSLNDCIDATLETTVN